MYNKVDVGKLGVDGFDLSPEYHCYSALLPIKYKK